MKNKYFLATVLGFLFTFYGAQAQFTDDFNWVPVGDCPPWWTTWPGGCPDIGGNGGCNPPYTGYIRPSDPGGGDVVDSILDLGNQTSGDWSLNFCMYIPSGREGYFNLQGIVPPAGGEWIVGNIFFNQDLVAPGEGWIDDSASGPVIFSFPHDQWFDVEMNFDLTGGMANATWEYIVNGSEVIPAGTAFTNSNGDVPTSLGGVNFFSVSGDNEYWIDLIDFTNNTPNPGTDDFYDTMEYITPMATEPWWDYGPIAIDDSNSQQGDKSGYMSADGSTTSVLNFGNQISGPWNLEFFMYVPSGKKASFSLQEAVPLGADGSIVGDIVFNDDPGNPGTGKITDSALGEVTFDFPQDEWFSIFAYFDLSGDMSTSVWVLEIGFNEAIPFGTPITNSNGDVPASLGGLQFTVPDEDGEFWIDNIGFYCPLLNMEDFSQVSFVMSPNPVQDLLSIEAEANFESVKIYGLDGKLALESGNERTIDVSTLRSGIYFVEIRIDNKKSVQKLVKQ